MKILTLDIETSPHKGYVWGMWQQNMAPGQLETPTRMLSWAAKFSGGSTMHYRTVYDKDFHSTLAALLSQADVLVTYNGNKFDIKHIKRELIYEGFDPPRPFASIDLLPIVKKNFNFPHNRLDYVCSVLLGETKLQTGGFSLWPAFMAGDEKALKIMKRYNTKDVRLTEKLYKHLRPWITNHPYVAPFEDDIEDQPQDYVCPCCASRHVTLTRPRRTRCYAIRVVHCEKCGHWFDGKRRKF